MYPRVLPRDLFNEAKLLKCMGQLSLKIHDGLRWPLKLEMTSHENFGFVVRQNPDDGGLFVTNLTLSLNGFKVRVESVYNSKQPYPLVFYDEHLGVGCVFNDDGSLAEEFEAYLDRLAALEPPHDPVC